MKGCERTQNKYYEAESTSLVAGIQIEHLHKVLFQRQSLLLVTAQKSWADRWVGIMHRTDGTVYG